LKMTLQGNRKYTCKLLIGRVKTDAPSINRAPNRASKANANIRKTYTGLDLGLDLNRKKQIWGCTEIWRAHLCLTNRMTQG